jgi:hypothetical protein
MSIAIFDGSRASPSYLSDESILEDYLDKWRINVFSYLNEKTVSALAVLRTDKNRCLRRTFES